MDVALVGFDEVIAGVVVTIVVGVIEVDVSSSFSVFMEIIPMAMIKPIKTTIMTMIIMTFGMAFTLLN
ncbi:MAG: hypothetical protein QXH97_01940 [Candidatus Bathyarchaeia archaeon]